MKPRRVAKLPATQAHPPTEGHHETSTHFIAVLAGVMTVLTVPVATAATQCHDCSTTIPPGVPALILLAPTSSTTVHAGAVVSLEANYIGAQVQPFSQLLYRGPGGTVTSIFLDTDTRPFSITVPSNWRHGRYRLLEVVTTAVGTGTQYRNHRFVGTTNASPPLAVCGRSALDLRAMDLTVTRT